jgi:limonene 1,2-monooxygenase
MRFGAWLAPFHAQRGQNPTLALQRDVETARLLERLGYDEVWFGEHHSAGAEPIASPELFCAYVAAVTARIKLGTGVIALPLHNPLWVAERTVLLDHLSRGRFMLGVGPGFLATDAALVGLDPTKLRDYLREDLVALTHLLRSDTPLAVKNDRYELVDARVQLAPWSDIEIAVTSTRSPNGPTLAGMFGLSMLQSTDFFGPSLDNLAKQIELMVEVAKEHDRVPNRAGVRVVGLVHLAESRDEAIANLAYGLDDFADYAQNVLGGHVVGHDSASRVEWAVESGSAIVGTAEEAIERLEHLNEIAGGFETFLHWGHEWATPEATRKSYEIFARRVMPALQGAARRLDESRDAAEADLRRRQKVIPS